MSIVARANRLAAAASALGISSVGASAQATLVGRVVADSVGGRPIAGAEVRLGAPGRSVRTDSAGRYSLTNLPAAQTLVTVRAVGFRETSAITALRADVSTTLDFVLNVAAQALPVAKVVVPPNTPAVMVGFYERRAQGIGHFIDRAQLEKFGDRRTGELLQNMVGGISVKNFGSQGAIATLRSASGRGGGSFIKGSGGLDPYDKGMGAPDACYSDVYLDGALVYSYAQAMRLFDINSLTPSQIEAIEVYTSTSQIPVKYNCMSAGCGVVLIWTRISRH